MSAHYTFNLNQLSDLPLSQAGQPVRTWAKLSDLDLHIPAFFILPSNIFEEIAKFNQLQRKLDTLFEVADWDSPRTRKRLANKIKHIASRLTVPDQVLHEIIDSYDALNSEFVKIVSDNSTQENVAGEHNLVENLIETMLTSMIDGQSFKAQPLMVQAQNQPEKSGMIYQDPQNKYHLIIKAVWGVYDPSRSDSWDEYKVDQRTLKVISHHTGTQKDQFQRQIDKLKLNPLSRHKQKQQVLTPSEIIRVSKLYVQLSRKFMSSQVADFSFKGNHLYIEAVSSHHENNFSASRFQTQLSAQSVTGGVIQAPVQWLKNFSPATNLSNHILVAERLKPQYLSLIKQAAGIILETTDLNPALLKYIKELHLPCVIGCTRAKLLKNGQLVTLNASSGKVSIDNSSNATNNYQTQKTVTKVYLSAGNPYQTQQPATTDGVFVKSDFLVAMQGQHPDYLLKHQNRKFKHNLLEATEKLFQPHADFFYRSCNLNSSELSHLKFGQEFEETEPNPYLGKRGGLKLIEDDLLFATEVEMLNQLAQKKNKKINLVVPFIRTTSELSLVISKIRQWSGNTQFLDIWLQLNTPANLLHFKEYLHQPIAGVVIQTKTVHDLAYGIDPDNPNIYNNYSFDEDLMIKLITQVVEQLKAQPLSRAKHSLPLVLKLNANYSRLVSLAARLSLQGVVVTPQLQEMVKEQIRETEQKLITNPQAQPYYA